MPAIGIRYHVAVDGISLWLVLLTTFITPIAAYASFGSIKTRIKELCFAFLLLQGAMIGVFVSLDLFLFYVFWEVMLVPMYVMIGIWGGVDKIRAAIKFFLYTMAGSMLMLAAMVYLVWTLPEAHRPVDVGLPRALRAWCCRARTRRSTASGPSRSPSSSRCRCGRCTPGCPTPTSRRPRAARSSSPRSCSSSAPTRYLRFSMGLFPGDGRPLQRQPRRRRHPRRRHLRRAGRLEAGRREAPGRLLVGGPPRLRDARPLRRARPRACRARCCRWSTTASPPARSSSWSASSTTAATPG